MKWFRKSRHSQTDSVDENGPYRVGEVVQEKYLVLSLLGRGGFGSVYLVACGDFEQLYAMKVVTVPDLATTEFFRREALFWSTLDKHPNILPAVIVDEVNGRLLIISEYIAKDPRGVNTLVDWCQYPHDVLDIAQIGYQVCDGLTHAYARGLVAHRDIKPANIMLANGSVPMVADFGVAITKESDVSFWRSYGVIGTPGYIAPEQLTAPASCDERSDIFSFCRVLVDMAESSLPSRLDDSLALIIEKGTATEAASRFQSFVELRAELEVIMTSAGAHAVGTPEVAELEAWEWNNRGSSLLNLGQGERALECFESALNLSPRSAPALYGKGRALVALGAPDRALAEYSAALDVQPDLVDALIGQATALRALGRHVEARESMSETLKRSPHDPLAWSVKANIEAGADNESEARAAYEKTLQLDPDFALAWFNLGTYLDDLGQYHKALNCLDKALSINPLDSNAWDNRGIILINLGKKKEAMVSFERALLTNPNNGLALANMAILLTGKTGKILPPPKANFEKASQLAARALEIDGRVPAAWYAYGLAHDGLGNDGEACQGYRSFLALAQPGMEAQIQWVSARLQRM